MDIIRGFSTLPKVSLPVGGRDDDVFADRLNYKYTTVFLIVSSFTITYKILQSDHIQCWVPAILSRYEHYINIYCWISNTYYVTYKEQTTSLTNKQERMVKYYQWVPIVLLVLALSFLLPRFVYRFLTKQSGIDLLNVADASINYMNVEKFDKRRKILTYLTNTIHFYSNCNKSKRFRSGFGSNSGGGGGGGGPNPNSLVGKSSTRPHIFELIYCHGKLNGAYLVVIYILTKLAYLANIIAQLFMLNLFLGFNYNSQGFNLLKDLTKGIMSTNDNRMFTPKQTPEFQGFQKNPYDASGSFYDHANSLNNKMFLESLSVVQNEQTATTDNQPYYLIHRYFPRESACDFRIRMNLDSMVHNYTVQCVLPINLFNEQLFTLLWVWFWLVFFVNIYDVVNWIFRLLPGSRYNYIRERIRFRTPENTVKRSLDAFVYDYLSSDGVFILRLLTLNASDSVTYDIVQMLWHNFTESNRAPRNQAAGSSGGGTKPNSGDNRVHQRFNTRSGGQQNSNNDNNQDSKYSNSFTNVENV